jgi:hypothetical protein
MVLFLLLWLAFSVTLNPPGQYADDRHLRARRACSGAATQPAAELNTGR